MIRHALAEGWLLLRQRAGVSLILALALAVPISLAGLGVSFYRWLSPMAGLSHQGSTVAVLLHPQLDSGQRDRWIQEQTTAHPGWEIIQVSPSDLAERLTQWFPYLDDLVASGETAMPPLIEIVTAEPEGVSILQGRREVLAIGPLTSIDQILGRVARRLAIIAAIVSAMLLAGSVLLAAVWVHLELYRHSAEITIMRLVGATEHTIRGPFIFAVAVPGLVAGVLSIIATLATAASVSRMTEALGLAPLDVSPQVLALQVTAAFLLPVVSALLTLARHASDGLDG